LIPFAKHLTPLKCRDIGDLFKILLEFSIHSKFFSVNKLFTTIK